MLFTPELLSPVGDRERLEAAIRYGADAVYLGGTAFGMRAASANFDAGGLADAVAFAHSHGVKVYLTCNTLPKNDEIDALPEFLSQARDAGVDALIIADVGILMLAKRLVPELALHISTQAGIVNYLTATEFFKLGASRVVLARELSLQDIRVIRDHTPPELELETFVHGAMCMSFSGRCLLSSYLTGRDANRGECAQPCRWGYHLTEEKRPGQHYPVFEDESGSYILNARDLCMVEHIDKLVEAGVSSLKIEGRAKSAYYVATVTGAYRGALDAYLKHPDAFVPPPWVSEEVRKVSHREYSTGFYFGTPEQYYQNAGYVRTWDIVAVVEGYEAGCIAVTARNQFSCGELLEIMVPRGAPIAYRAEEIRDDTGACVERANHPMRRYLLPNPTPLPVGSMVRRETREER